MGVQNDLLNELRALRASVSFTAQVPSTPGSSRIAASTIRALDVLMTIGTGAVVPALNPVPGWAWPIGIARQAGAPGTEINVAVPGDEVEDASWSWAPGQSVWLGDDARLTQGGYSGAYFVVIGVALTATRVLVRVEQPVKLA
jgi:hypothetical protein